MTTISRLLFCLALLFSGFHLTAQALPRQYGVPFNKVPDPRDVSIYQVNIRVFSREGNLNGVIARLDSIKALGTNVIYLMPTYPVGQVKGVNSPYCIRDYRSVNPEFGSLADLQKLVAESHRRGMAVLMDWVANHTSFDHTWIKNKGWYVQDSLGNIISPPGTGWNDVAQLNFSNPSMTAEMIRCMKYWVLTANIDGFRCDYTDGPPFEFWKQALDTLRNTTGHRLIMLSEGRRSDHFTAGFDYNFGFDFFNNMKRIYENGLSARTIDSFNLADYKNTTDKQRMVRYTSNHDVNGSDGTPLELFGGLKGSMAAFVVVAYMKSIPMIYGGQEVGTPYRLRFPFTEKDVDWSLNPDLTAEYKKVLAFYNSSAALRRGRLSTYSNNDVVCFKKVLRGKEVLVLVNMREGQKQFPVPVALRNSKWKNAFSQKPVFMVNEMALSGYEYLVLKK